MLRALPSARVRSPLPLLLFLQLVAAKKEREILRPFFYKKKVSIPFFLPPPSFFSLFGNSRR